MNDISVIIPAFNAANTLQECIQSVISQSFKPREIIFINDGSSDASLAIAQGFQHLKVINQVNQGVASAMNQGLKLAKSEFFAFIDADDIWVSDSLEIQMKALTRDPHADGVVSWMKEFICPSLSAPDMERFKPRNIQQAWVSGATLVHRRIYDQIGGLNSQLRIGAWIDWIDRARLSGFAFTTHEQVLLMRRLHPNSLSVQYGKSPKEGMMDVVRLALERRRNLNG